MPRIQVDVSQEDLSALTMVFPGRANINEAARIIAELAFEEWAGWLTGKKRHTSLTDQSIDRVINIFLNAMPEGTEPDINFLYNNFNMPYGRAAYIKRVIEDRQQHVWNTVAKKELVERLKDKIEEYNGMSRKERGLHPWMQLDVSCRAGKLLISAIERMPDKDDELVNNFKRVTILLTNIYAFKLPSRYLDSILEAVGALPF